MTLSCPFDEVIEQARPLFGGGRGRKPGPSSLARVGCEGELRNQEQTALYVGEAAIHSACIVGKYPVRQQPLQEAIGLCRLVAALDSNEYQEPGRDCRNAAL